MLRVNAKHDWEPHVQNRAYTGLTAHLLSRDLMLPTEVAKSHDPVATRPPLARGGWVVLSGIAVVCLVIGTQNLVLAHRYALTLGLPAPNSDATPPQGMYDGLVIAVSGLTVIVLMWATCRLLQGNAAQMMLGMALVGTCFVLFDAHSVAASGWLGDCTYCGGPIEAAKDRALHAMGLTFLSAVCILLGLVWLRLRDDW